MLTLADLSLNWVTIWCIYLCIETIAPSINEEDETIDLLDSEEKVESENNKMDFESDKV